MWIIALFIPFLVPQGYAVGRICSLGETNVKEHSRKEYQKSDGTKVRKSFVTEHCRDIFPNSKDWIKKFKNTPPSSWPNKNEQNKAWNEAEIKIILDILNELPPELRSFFDGDIHRFISSNFFDNPASVYTPNNSLVIYDQFFKLSSDERLRVVAHEISHFLYNRLSYAKKNEFAVLSGWSYAKDKKSKNQMIQLIPPNKLIQPDSVESPDEDFANHFELNFMSPKDYVKFNPQTSTWFQHQFPWAKPKRNK